MSLLVQEQEERALAELVHIPGFRVLIKRLREVETDTLGKLKAEGNQEKAHTLLRYWQFLSRFIDILEMSPTLTAAALQQEEERAQRSAEEQVMYDLFRPSLLDFFRAPQDTMNIEETNEQ